MRFLRCTFEPQLAGHMCTTATGLTRSSSHTESGLDPWRSEDEEPPPKRFHGSTPLTFKFLAPNGLVNLISANAKSIKDVAGGSVTITDSDDHYPNTKLQVGTLQATVDGDMVSAMRRILYYASECGECIAENGTELRFTVVMPSKSVSALIGVKGANVQVLQRATGCHIHVDGVALGFGPGGDRAVHINGGPPSLEKAICRAIECVKEFQDTPWFPKWAARTNAERLAATEAPPLPNNDVEVTNLKSSKSGTDGFDMIGMVGMGGMRNISGMPMGFVGGMGGMNLLGGMGLMPGMGAMGMIPGMGAMPSIPSMSGMSSMAGGMSGMAGGMSGVAGGMSNMAGSMSSVAGMCGMGGMGAMGAPGPVMTMGGNPTHARTNIPSGSGMSSNVMGMSARMGDASSVDEKGEHKYAGPEMVIQAVKDLPPFISQDPRGFLLRCALPGVLASRLLGKDGSGTKEVQDLTGTRITIPGSSDEVTRMMNIEGPLLGACAAYMLMMKRYVEAEQEINSMGGCINS